MPKLAVLGQPISHSRSPAMQSAALAELGLAGEWTYEAIEVTPEKFEARVGAMPAEGFVGANVTVPHKLAALAVADEASEAARSIGAANTLSFDGERIAAENTDAAGFLDALPGSGRLPAETVARARRYAYHFFFRRMIPITTIVPNTGLAARQNKYRINVSRLDDLRPGRDPGLDVICDGILRGEPFVYRAESRP